MEKESDGAVTYVHVDCRDFDLEYHDNKYFTKNQENVIGKSIVELANELGFKDTCSCLSSSTNDSSNLSGGECYCFKEGRVAVSCNSKGVSIPDDVYEKEAARLGIEVAVMQAIVRILILII